MDIAKNTLFIVALILAIGTVLPLIKSHYWWIRSWDFPRVHLLIANILVMGLIMMTPQPLDWIDITLISVLSIATLYHAILIAKYTRIAKVQTQASNSLDKSRSIRILVVNVRMRNKQYERAMSAIRESDPDVVLILEPNAAWAQALSPLKTDYLYNLEEHLENTYGLILYSRLRLHNEEINYIVKEHVPSVHAFIELPSGDKIEFYGLHPMPPVPGTDSDERDAEILIVGKKVKKGGHPAIVVGDLNDVAWSHTTRLFQRISQMLDPRVGRGFYNTYNALIPVFRFPLDHVFHTPHFQLGVLKRLSKIGSDHYPMFVELFYEPDEKHTQDAPKSKKSDHGETEKKIAEGLDGD